VWSGVVWSGVVWCGVVWSGVVWCGVVWCGVVWCGVVWSGVVWSGVVLCGVVSNREEVKRTGENFITRGFIILRRQRMPLGVGVVLFHAVTCTCRTAMHPP